MTLSLDEAEAVARRREPLVAWGVGCHPRDVKAQADFSVERFRQLVEGAAIIGEVGLDVRSSKVPLDVQLRTFRAALRTAAETRKPVSIHSYTATSEVLAELRRTPVPAPILHWWTGTAAQTQEAVSLGCYFSVHSAVARRSLFRTRVPLERLLVESDHGWSDPPAAIPCRIEWVEHLLGESLKRPREEIRALAWRNFAAIVTETAIGSLLPSPLVGELPPTEPGGRDAGLFGM
jgi:TatD DNase family protein